MRRVVLVAPVVALSCAMPGAAQAAEYGAWRVSTSGSVSHRWTVSSSEPCAPTGSGVLTASMQGRSGRFQMGYFTRGGYRHWSVHPRLFRVRGEILRTDSTVQNPGEDALDTCTPTDKTGCVRRRLDRNANASVAGMNSRRRPGITISFNNLMNAFDDVEGRCENADFHDFSRFLGQPRAENGQLIGRMPSPARVRRRRAFTVRVVQTSRARDGAYETTTVRRATLRFVPASTR